MSLSESVEVLFQQLDSFRGFPKYALERRLDVFVSLFLEEYLSTRFEAPVRIVAPEFPLKREQDFQSINVDYLLRREGSSPAWLFLELKTSEGSIDKAQLALYREARERGMHHWRKAVMEIHGRIRSDAARSEKYEVLLKALASAGAWHSPELPDLPIEVVYLSPPSRAFEASGFKEWGRWLPLEEFARWQPRRHPELWAHVRKLLAPAGT